MGRQALAKQTECTETQEVLRPRFLVSRTWPPRLSLSLGLTSPFALHTSTKASESFPPLQAQFLRHESRTSVTPSIRWEILCPLLPRKKQLEIKSRLPGGGIRLAVKIFTQLFCTVTGNSEISFSMELWKW